MIDAMPPPLPDVFDRQIRDAIRQDCRAAYALAADRIYSPSDGWGPMLFGVAIYFNLDSRFRERFGSESRLQYVLGTRRPELQAADVRVYWNKTGTSAGRPTLLERPSGALLEMAGQNLAVQMSMFGSSDPVSWVIAHAGNPQDGLASIHIAAPQLARNGRVVGWQQAVAIFDARRPDLDLPELAAPGLPEPTPLPDFDLSFRPDAPAGERDEELPATIDAG
jgi:hypothetical protein